MSEWCCASLAKTVRNAYWNVVYDDEMNEVHVLAVDPKGYTILRFCPFCGVRLPPSTRPAGLDWNSNDDTRALEALCSRLRTLECADAVLRELGSSFELRTAPNTSTRPDPWTHLYLYRKLRGEFGLQIRKYANGSLRISLLEPHQWP